MNAITTHVLDTARGRPASGVPLLLEVRSESGEWRTLAKATTDGDGRATVLEKPFGRGVYRLTFDTGAYFRAWNIDGFYPEVQVLFEVRDLSQHQHIPLLVAPYGYTTYRGT
jgi:5-hydroxyisourate hydrolase